MNETPTAKTGADARWHAALAHLTGGLSPAALAPDAEDAADPDPRFAGTAWTAFPYSHFAQGFFAKQKWWDLATKEISCVDPKHSQIVNFAARQWIDVMSPANCALTNPEVITRTARENGQNLVRGLLYWLEDFNRLMTQEARKSQGCVLGESLATTPGDVVLKSDLIELIRYHPTTDKLQPEPILIVLAWIMKNYILDLTAERSLVAYLRDQGFEVYIISWKNPGKEDTGLRLQDYAGLGVRAAIDKITRRGAESLHAVGYCLGGTLLSIVAAALARDGKDTLASLSLLASQVDFSNPGELALFINESQIAFLEDMMETRGYLKADQMAGAFRMLRSNDLIWSRVIRHYLLGERTPDNPLLAWNADATRMPAAMHSEYLRRMFPQNDLAAGRFDLDGAPVALTDIRCTVHSLATETDHVSPWRSVYKLLLLTDTDVTFALTNGGHNGGVLSEPGHEGRHYRCGHKTEGDRHLAPQLWFDRTEPQDGSWWPHWKNWLAKRSRNPATHQAAKQKTFGKAPGRYVFG